MKVAKTKTDEWPSGRAFAVMEMLLKKYRPKDSLSNAHQKKKLMSLKSKRGEDPDKFALEIEYRNDFEEEDRIIALVGAAGHKIASTIISKTKRLENNGKEVTCDDLIEAMCEHQKTKTEEEASATFIEGLV